MKYYNRVVRAVFNDGNGTSHIIEDLHISFDIDKSTRATPSYGKITIYNLSKNTAAIMQSSKKTATIELYAGYSGLDNSLAQSVGMIFKGNPTKITTAMDGVDRVTLLECGDGQTALQTAKISKTFSSSIKPSEIIGNISETILKEMPNVNVATAVPKIVERVNSLVKDNPFPRGVVLSGQASTQMDYVCAALKLGWFIEDGELQFHHIDQPLRRDAVHLSPESGLIGSPVLADKGRIEVTALLQPLIKPGQVVSISSQDFQGFYIVKRIQHYGDSGMSDDFYTKLELSTIPKR